MREALALKPSSRSKVSGQSSGRRKSSALLINSILTQSHQTVFLKLVVALRYEGFSMGFNAL